MKNTFSKDEKLTDLRIIDELFKKGKSFSFPPLKILLLPLTVLENKATIQVLISVPKKSVKKAVNRNKIKRRLREIYRLNKATFFTFPGNNNQSFALAIIYYGKPDIDYETLTKNAHKLFDKVAKHIAKA
ncbi:MAG: ribonuclease P protein component [Bacteroidia bacterium]|nr:ribonuclease P protein component [Bacteroidia bacterium]